MSSVTRASGKGVMKNGRERAEYGATISFENADGRRLTVANTHMPVRSAIKAACVEARMLDATYRVVSISTPDTIFSDLQQREISHGRPDNREEWQLSHVGETAMLHPRLAGRGEDRWSY